jgi:DNA-binding response OmpR family regulator
MALHRNPQLVILDVMLPKLDGWQVCRELRQHSNVPVLMLTAREEEFDRVLGLSLGADDYVVKPFSPRELMARVKAILRRTAPGVPSPTAARVHGDLVLDPVKHKVTLGHRTIDLTGFEFKLLQTLISAPGRVFSREELLNRYYPDGEVVVDRVIDVHIGNLRRKIERNPGRPEYILTVRGFGYRFRETDEP